jgi:hypothetical protein
LHNTISGHGNGRRLKDIPPVAGGTSPYYLGVGRGGDITVVTTKAHGAARTDAHATGAGKCADA